MTNMMKTIRLVIRITQIVFSIIVLGCSAYQLSAGWRFDGLGMALFTSLTGLMLSGLMVLGPRLNTVLAERLPGLIDIILSGIWTIFFLASGASVGAYGTCSNWAGYSLPGWSVTYSPPAAAVCGTWNAVIAFAILNFVLYGASTVFAGLDLKDGKGLVKPKGFNSTQNASHDIEVAAKKPAVNGQTGIIKA